MQVGQPVRRLLILVVVASIIGLVWLAIDDDLFIATSDLQVSEMNTGTDPSEHTLQFSDNDRDFGRINLEIQNDTLRANLVLPSDLEAQSIEFTLFRSRRTAPPPSVALRTPGGFPWPPIEFSHTADGLGTRVAIEDLGIQGRGSTTIEFDLLEQTEDWSLFIDVGLHSANLPIFERSRATSEVTISEQATFD